MKQYSAVSWVFLMGIILGLTGCNQERPEHIMRVYITAGHNPGIGGMYNTITLPKSGKQFSIQAQPIIPEGDIINVELARVSMGEGLLLQFSEMASRVLYRQTASNQGQYLILFINGKPAGARIIDYAMSDGQFFTFVEMRNEDLRELFPKLKESVQRVQELK